MTTTYIQINGISYDASAMEKPPSRAFRSAWEVNDEIIEVNMVKAREIQKEKLRQERSVRFGPLDAEYNIAMEQGDQTKMTAIAMKRQTLRDVTSDPRIANAGTPEALSALTLDYLLANTI